jgi:hypothetical protein
VNSTVDCKSAVMSLSDTFVTSLISRTDTKKLPMLDKVKKDVQYDSVRTKYMTECNGAPDTRGGWMHMYKAERDLDVVCQTKEKNLEYGLKSLRADCVSINLDIGKIHPGRRHITHGTKQHRTASFKNSISTMLLKNHFQIVDPMLQIAF